MAVVIDANGVRGWYPRQPWHSHDRAADHYNEFCAGSQSDFPDLHVVTRRRAKQVRIR